MRPTIGRSLLIAAAGLLVALPAGAIFAQQQTPGAAAPHTAAGIPCGKRTEVVRILRENYNERPVAHGLANSGALAEIFSSPKGTWTIVATTPEGVSCMIGSGESWQTTLARDDTI